jgi:hypothetical protein
MQRGIFALVVIDESASCAGALADAPHVARCVAALGQLELRRMYERAARSQGAARMGMRTATGHIP